MRIFDKLMSAWRFGRAMPARLKVLDERLDNHQRLIESAAHAAVEESRRHMAHTDSQIHLLRGMLASQAESSTRELGELAQGLQKSIEALRSQVAALAAALDRGPAAGAGSAPGPTPAAAALEEGFYPLLEAHFRGSEADVKRRLGGHRDAVDAMPPGKIADLGCGRGEWLELLGGWGRDCVGVDSNALVAAELRARGLRVEEGDALAWLRTQPEASFAGVTAFHVAEHLPFGVLLQVLMEARRVLQPGGSLILETPNPENVTVATHSFWLDPTHLRPLPAELLELAARYCGFEGVTVKRLHPPENGEGPGRDYSLTARKAGAQ